MNFKNNREVHRVSEMWVISIMENQIETQNKSTKEVILEYLKINHGREIPVSEISEKFNFKLARISNAIKELELEKEINIERRPIKKGKYTVISLTGDIITEFATHEREIERKKVKKAELSTPVKSDELSISKTIEQLMAYDFEESKFEDLIRLHYKNNWSLTCDFVQPIMYEVGKLWQNEKLTVGAEHLISARMEKIITKLIQNLEPTILNKPLIILAPSEDEYHTLGLNILELLFTERGYKVINLAYTIDALSLVSFIKKAKIYPNWIFFSLTIPTFKHNLRMNIKIIKDELQMSNLKIAIGGQGVRDIDLKEFTEADKIIKNNQELYDLLYSI